MGNRDSRQRFTVKHRNITSDIIDDEVVIVNLERGFYYSLTGVGTDLWRCLRDRMSIAQTLETLATRYGSSVEEISLGIHALLDELEKESLVFEEAPTPQSIESVSALPDFVPAKLAFTIPTLSKYTDMQDLLLLDPIREGLTSIRPYAVPPLQLNN